MLLVRWSTRRNIGQVGLTSLVNGVHDPLALAIRGGDNVLQKIIHADPDPHLTDQFGAVFISDLKNKGENQIEDPAMHLHSRFKAFRFQTWIEANQHLLKPPVVTGSVSFRGEADQIRSVGAF